jgi:beta-aspartyl-peptidase (threonine type)
MTTEIDMAVLEGGISDHGKSINPPADSPDEPIFGDDSAGPNSDDDSLRDGHSSTSNSESSASQDLVQTPDKKLSTTLDKSSIADRSLWRDTKNYAIRALHSPWHTTLFRMQDTFLQSSNDFFRDPAVGYKYLIVPLTTGSISSPMGFGSDSQPVSVELNGQQTYLADSQQFLLEYALRLEHDLPGAYYVGTSCRGEDHDATHLNQFCHVECELLGGLEEAMSVANQYVAHVTKAFLTRHSSEIEAYAGSTSHLQSLLDLYKKHGDAFPVVTLEEALALPELTDEMWEYVIPGQVQFGKKITRAGERMLMRRFGGAVWLTEFDHLSTPFYQAYTGMTERGVGAKAKTGDLLLGLGEVLGCGERHETVDDALQALRQHEVDPQEYQWYVDMRDAKPLRTSGWEMGMERVLAWILQHDDVRDVQLLPRLKGLEIAP